MSAITIFGNENASLWFHPEAKMVHHQFRKFMFGDRFKNVLDRGYEVLKANNATKWLSDDRGNSALRTEDAGWAQKEWFPPVAAAGWKFWAIVLPPEHRRHDEHATIHSAVRRGGNYRAGIHGPRQALKWLESAQEKSRIGEPLASSRGRPPFTAPALLAMN